MLPLLSKRTPPPPPPPLHEPPPVPPGRRAAELYVSKGEEAGAGWGAMEIVIRTQALANQRHSRKKMTDYFVPRFPDAIGILLHTQHSVERHRTMQLSTLSLLLSTACSCFAVRQDRTSCSLHGHHTRRCPFAEDTAAGTQHNPF